MSFLPEEVSRHNLLTLIGASIFGAFMVMGSLGGIFYYAEHTNRGWLTLLPITGLVLVLIGLTWPERRNDNTLTCPNCRNDKVWTWVDLSEKLRAKCTNCGHVWMRGGCWKESKEGI